MNAASELHGRIYSVSQFTAVLLIVIAMGGQPLSETVCRMDAASERTWTYLQRVSGKGYPSIAVNIKDSRELKTIISY